MLTEGKTLGSMCPKQQLRPKAKKVGHWAMARWMQKNGFSFHYAYFIIFGQRNKREHF